MPLIVNKQTDGKGDKEEQNKKKYKIHTFYK